VFISSDKDEASFSQYYGEMASWLALPFSMRDRKEQLSKKFKVKGIPTFVMLDNKANTITTKARSNVSEDPSAADFPWRPKSLWDLLGPHLINNKGEKVETASHLKHTTAFAIYFSAHWCGPCRQFTPQLIKTYHKLKADGKKFEVVFVSSDNDQKMFDEYFKEMPWLAIPYSESSRRSALDGHFEIEGIPTFILVDGATGKVISKNARASVVSDPEGKDFPWLPKPLSTVDDGASQLNDVPCFVYVNPDITDDEISALNKLAQEYTDKWKHLDEQPLIFMYGKSGGMASRVLEFTNVKSPKALLILNIPEGTKAVHEGTDFNEHSFKQFIDGFVAGTAKTKGLKE